MTVIEAHEVAEMFLASECAELLLLRACDTTAPELAARCAQALRWLDVDDDDPRVRVDRPDAGDVLVAAVAEVTRAVVYHVDRGTRARCAGLVAALTAEAARLRAEVAA